jgi:transcriptional regulator with XRE-family HTH domain
VTTAPFGTRLRQWRRGADIKQQRLADLLNVNQTTVSRWENGAIEPTPTQRVRLEELIAGHRPGQLDRVLRRLVETTSDQVHLICDRTHRLLAASPAREASWSCSTSDLTGTELFPFASVEIRRAERRLFEMGWFEGGSEALLFHTGRNDDARVHIYDSWVLWERLLLEDGTPVRLVTTPPENRLASLGVTPVQV